MKCSQEASVRQKKDAKLLLFRKMISENLAGNVEKIILFGSRARGNFDRYADYDFLIVVKKCDKKVKEAILEIEGKLLYEHNAVFSALPFTKKDLKERAHEPFIINATREGIPL